MDDGGSAEIRLRHKIQLREGHLPQRRIGIILFPGAHALSGISLRFVLVVERTLPGVHCQSADIAQRASQHVAALVLQFGAKGGEGQRLPRPRRAENDISGVALDGDGAGGLVIPAGIGNFNHRVALGLGIEVAVPGDRDDFRSAACPLQRPQRAMRIRGQLVGVPLVHGQRGSIQQDTLYCDLAGGRIAPRNRRDDGLAGGHAFDFTRSAVHGGNRGAFASPGQRGPLRCNLGGELEGLPNINLRNGRRVNGYSRSDRRFHRDLTACLADIICPTVQIGSNGNLFFVGRFPCFYGHHFGGQRIRGLHTYPPFVFALPADRQPRSRQACIVKFGLGSICRL